MRNILYRTVFIVAVLSTLWSLYYWRFGDPFINIQTWELFLKANALEPCEMCRFARIFMYPIVVIVGIGIVKKSYEYLSVLILSGLWVLLEAYQYRYQMTKSTAEVDSFICNGLDEASCAAVDVIYWWFITIPFLCLVAFVMIFIATLMLRKNYLSK